MKLHLGHIKNVYLIGIGGIGMSGLARYFNYLGCTVSGYDRSESELTKVLETEGICISYEDDIVSLPIEFDHPATDKLIIYTPAIPVDSNIKIELQNRGFVLHKRSEVLGIISKDKFTIAVAGTHGKTTTSTLIAHILSESGLECSAFLGGISANYDTNVLIGKGDIVVVEADEYDRSFLTLFPDISVVTSLQADHLDIYGDIEHIIESFNLFIENIKEGGKTVVKKGLPVLGSLSYSLQDNTADVYAENIRIKNQRFYFNYKGRLGDLHEVYLGMPGYHNVENAIAAISVAKLLKIENHKIVQALVSFKGVKRRFEYIVNTGRHVFIDDYAHHPEELKAFLNSVKKLYPEKKLTVIFQPHLFTRTKDFVEEFADALSLADELLLLDIYPARELPIVGVSSEWLLKKVNINDKRCVSKDTVLDIIREEQPSLIVTVGAGDIDRLVQPIKAILDKYE